MLARYNQNRIDELEERIEKLERNKVPYYPEREPEPVLSFPCPVCGKEMQEAQIESIGKRWKCDNKDCEIYHIEEYNLATDKQFSEALNRGGIRE